MPQSAIGFIETRGLVGVIEAADAAAKAANVQLMDFEKIGSGLVSIRFYGDVASVQVAVEAGAEAARQVSEVISRHVIPAPHVDLAALLEGPVTPGLAPAPAPSGVGNPSLEELQTLSVAQLRRLVRQAPESQFKGRQISRANKETLIAELQRIRQEDS